MDKIKIKQELLAERCEICHQVDCFDPINSNCIRCNRIAIENFPTENHHLMKNTLPRRNQKLNLVLWGKVILTPVVIVISFNLWVILFSEYGYWYIRDGLLCLSTMIAFIILPIWLLFLPNLLKLRKDNK